MLAYDFIAYKHETAQSGWYVYDIDDNYVYFRYFNGADISRLCKSKLRRNKKDYLQYFMSHGKRLYIGDFIKPMYVWEV